MFIIINFLRLKTLFVGQKNVNADKLVHARPYFSPINVCNIKMFFSVLLTFLYRYLSLAANNIKNTSVHIINFLQSAQKLFKNLFRFSVIILSLLLKILYYF